MYAIFRSGGKQFRVQAGDTVRVDKLEKELGAEFHLDEVLLIGGGEKTHIGTPTVANAKVSVVVAEQGKGQKVIVFKKKRRQGYRRTQGHRQLYTALFVKEITSPDGETAKTDKKANVIDPAKKADRLAKLAEKQAEEKQAAKKAGKATPKKKKKKAVKKKAAKKKTAKKAVAKKKTAKKKAAKKKTAAKKATTKKTAAKKATKKTTKKA